MVCMDGFVLTHVRTSPSTSRPRPTSTRSCRPSSRVRCSIPTTRSRSARWWGPRPSPRCGTSSTPAGAGAGHDPRDRRRVRPAVRTLVRRACTPLPQRGCGHRGGRARLGARDDRRGRRRAARRGQACRRARNHLLLAVAARRGARGAGAREPPSCSSARSPSASAGSWARTCGWPCPAPSRPSTTSSQAWRPARDEGLAPETCSTGRSPPPPHPPAGVPRPRLAARRPGVAPRREQAALGAARREHAARDLGVVAGWSH